MIRLNPRFHLPEWRGPRLSCIGVSPSSKHPFLLRLLFRVSGSGHTPLLSWAPGCSPTKRPVLFLIPQSASSPSLWYTLRSQVSGPWILDRSTQPAQTLLYHPSTQGRSCHPGNPGELPSTEIRLSDIADNGLCRHIQLPEKVSAASRNADRKASQEGEVEANVGMQGVLADSERHDYVRVAPCPALGPVWISLQRDGSLLEPAPSCAAAGAMIPQPQGLS